MPFEPSIRVPGLWKNGDGPGKPSNLRGDGFTGGCISLIVLFIEIPVAYLLGLTSVIRGMGDADGPTAAPAMDWTPIFWFGGFTLGVLMIAVLFLYSAHPFAGAVQLFLAAVALLFTIAVWHDQHEQTHPGAATHVVIRSGHGEASQQVSSECQEQVGSRFASPGPGTARQLAGCRSFGRDSGSAPGGSSAGRP
ncbi:DUF6234 family protein [Streptomyces anthocyanicus]|uniref:DUF6234 family protein n=1 Tax=Streptomyces TaxID=1883 RepID=UPI00109E9736|nr:MULTISPECIES: DUF6234 family protein [Streptomyces]MCW8117816.1 DUF6234 family protein [Streptomyces anthocyanicus]THB00190.1 hypothetical protein E6R61_00565 [Streptomyces sp. LRa12]